MTIANAKPDLLITGPIGTSMVNAASSAWHDYLTVEAKITAAIAYAVSIGAKYCYVPDSFLPYTASLVTFNTAVKMTREGANPAAWDVMAYGAAGNNIANDTAAIQAAINGSFSGNPGTSGYSGYVFFPAGDYVVTASLTMPGAAIRLVGAEVWLDRNYPYTRISAAAAALAGPVFNIGARDNISFENLSIIGGGAVTGAQGIAGTTCAHLSLYNVYIGNCGDQGLVTTGGAGARIENLWVENCCLVRTGRVAWIGAVDLGGTDLWVTNSFATASLSASFATNQAILNASNKWIASWRFNTGHSFYHAVIGEFASSGIVVAGTGSSQTNRFSECRASQNLGHGWTLEGGGNGGHQFIGCFAFNNGLDANNTYDGFTVGAVQNNLFAANMIGAAQANTTRHGFTDTSGGVTENDGNSYVGNKLYGTGVAGVLYNILGAGSNLYGVTHPHRASGDRGDASITVQAGQDAETQMFNTPLTAGRSVTLSVTGAWNGARFRIARTAAATGASTLTVNAKALTVGQWIEVEYIWALSGWQTVGFGSL